MRNAVHLRFVFLISVFISLADFLFAQGYSKLVSDGDDAYENKNYEQAVKYYSNAVKLLKEYKPKDAQVFFNLADAQMQLKKYQEASENFAKALEVGADYFDDEEKKALNEKKEFCERELMNIPAREELMKRPIEINIVNLGKNINSPSDDYCPSVNADETFLIFTSRREGSTGGKKDLDELPFEDFYSSRFKDSTWLPAKNLGAPINTENHESIPCISADGQTVYFYKWQNPEVEKKNDKNFYGGNGDIFTSKIKGKTWTPPKKLPKEINTEYWESHPSVSADGTTLYFVSNRPGGFGNRDIYVSHKDKNGKWTAPVNLGDNINTEHDEASPFIHPDGVTLYFSSKGYPGMGGYDIFVSHLQSEGKWSEPENMGYPINSEGDDVFFRMAASGNRAYISSVRPDGLGGQDIYEMYPMRSKDTTQAIKQPECVVLVKGIVKEQNTNTPLEAIIIFENLDTKTEIAKFNSNSETGEYLVVIPAGATYGITVQKDGYLFQSGNLNVAKENCEYREINNGVVLSKIEVGQSVVMNNIGEWEFGKWNLPPQASLELEKVILLINQNPKMKIEISGHTDSHGGEELNMNLSQKRAEAVVEYLVSHGIDRSRLVAKGYGESKPIAPNENADDSDNPDGRAKNRRTEFKILEN